jgi:primosomal protein N' (replication factor Y)
VPIEYYRTILPSEAIDLIRHAEKKKFKIFIYTNRKGIAPLSRCSDCGTIVDCPNCSLPMVLRNKVSREKGNERYFICTHCGETLPPEYLCSHCGSWNITPLAIGTESLRNEIISLVGANAVVTIDDDLTPDSKMIEKLLAEIQSKKFAVIVGTIKVLPYIKGIKYTMFPFFDRMLSVPSPYTTENILRLIMECDERSIDGVIVCTRNPEFSFTRELAEQKINAIIHDELELRKDLSYPPFGSIVKISITVPEGYKAKVKEEVEKYFKGQDFIAHPPRKISIGSMKVLMVWILKTSINFIEEEGVETKEFLESLRFPYRIEQNPERL